MSDRTETEVPTGRARLEPPDLSEKGGMKGGQPQHSDERLFMQLMVFGGCADPRAAANALANRSITGALYEDLNDPRGIAVLTVGTSPSDFLDRVRPVLTSGAFSDLVLKPEHTMFGRTYSLGYEPDLRETL